MWFDHPPAISIFIGGIDHPQMGSLWHCFNHMSFSADPMIFMIFGAEVVTTKAIPQAPDIEASPHESSEVAPNAGKAAEEEMRQTNGEPQLQRKQRAI